MCAWDVSAEARERESGGECELAEQKTVGLALRI